MFVEASWSYEQDLKDEADALKEATEVKILDVTWAKNRPAMESNRVEPKPYAPSNFKPPFEAPTTKRFTFDTSGLEEFMRKKAAITVEPEADSTGGAK